MDSLRVDFFQKSLDEWATSTITDFYQNEEGIWLQSNQGLFLLDSDQGMAGEGEFYTREFPPNKWIALWFLYPGINRSKCQRTMVDILAGPGSGTLGYASFPGTEPDGLDGMVIGYKFLGTTGAAEAPTDLGRTVTHEIGHWLNLIHIWGDETDCSGEDMVGDIPGQMGPFYGCPTTPAGLPRFFAKILSEST